MKVHGSGLKVNGHDVKCTVFTITVIGENYTVMMKSKASQI